VILSIQIVIYDKIYVIAFTSDEDITTTDLNHVTLNSITTNWSGSSTSSVDEDTTELLVTPGNLTLQSTTSNDAHLFTTNTNSAGWICNLPHENLMDEELLRNITYLVNELKINRKQTLLGISISVLGKKSSKICRGCRGRDRMIVGFTTTCAISTYPY